MGKSLEEFLVECDAKGIKYLGCVMGREQAPWYQFCYDLTMHIRSLTFPAPGSDRTLITERVIPVKELRKALENTNKYSSESGHDALQGDYWNIMATACVHLTPATGRLLLDEKGPDNPVKEYQTVPILTMIQYNEFCSSHYLTNGKMDKLFQEAIDHHKRCLQQLEQEWEHCRSVAFMTQTW